MTCVQPDNSSHIAFRYPGDVLEPEKDEVCEALEAAQKVLSFVLGKVPGIAKDL